MSKDIIEKLIEDIAIHQRLDLEVVKHQLKDTWLA